MFLTDGYKDVGENAVRNVAINRRASSWLRYPRGLFVCFEGDRSPISESPTARARKSQNAFFAAGESGVEPVSPKKWKRSRLSRPRCVCTTATAVAVGYSSGAVRLWELVQGAPLEDKAELLAHVGCHARQEVASMQVGQGDFLISNSIHEVILWGRASDIIASYRQKEDIVPLWRKTLDHSVEQAAVFRNGGGSFLVACTQQHDVALFETSPERRRYLGRLKGHTGPVSCVRFGMWSGIWLFSGGFDGSIRIWTPKANDPDPLSIECVTSIQTSTNWIMDIALSEARQLVTVSSDRFVRVYALQEEVNTSSPGTWLDGRWSTNFGVLEVADGKGRVLNRLWMGDVAVKRAAWYLCNLVVCDKTRVAHGWWGEENKGTGGQFTLYASDDDTFVGSFCANGISDEGEEWRGTRLSFDAYQSSCVASFTSMQLVDSPRRQRSSAIRMLSVFASPARLAVVRTSREFRRRSLPIEHPSIDASSSSDSRVGRRRCSSIGSSSSDYREGDTQRWRNTDNADSVPIVSDCDDSCGRLLPRRATMRRRMTARVCAEMFLPEGGTCVDVDRTGRHIAVGTVGGRLCTWSADWHYRRIAILVRARLAKEAPPTWLAVTVLSAVYSRCSVPWGHWPQLPEDLFQHMCTFL